MIKGKILAGLSLAGIVFAIILLVYREGKSSGKNEEVKKQLEIETKIQNEIIEEKKQIHQRTLNHEIISVDADLKWLYENSCKDCKS